MGIRQRQTRGMSTDHPAAKQPEPSHHSLTHYAIPATHYECVSHPVEPCERRTLIASLDKRKNSTSGPQSPELRTPRHIRLWISGALALPNNIFDECGILIHAAVRPK